MSKRNADDTLGGALVCGAAGAYIGGPIGAVIGGVVGGLLGGENVMSIVGWAGGQKESQYRKYSHDDRFSREQREEFTSRAEEVKNAREEFDNMRKEYKESRQ